MNYESQNEYFGLEPNEPCTDKIYTEKDIQKFKESWQQQLNLFMSEKTTIDEILENLRKADKIFGNLKIQEAINKFEHLKAGYLC